MATETTKQETIATIIRELLSKGHQQRGNHYRGISPLRNDSDGKNFVFTVSMDNSAVWYDHKEGKGGDWYELAKIMGIDVPHADSRKDDTLKVYEGLADYAAAQGSDAQTFIDAGWSREAIIWQGRKALTYKTISGTHLRFLDGQKPKYKPMEMGYKRCWYGLDRAIEMASKRNTFIIITNGAPSVVVAQSFELPAAACIGGENALQPDLIDLLRSKWNGEIIIALDCDTQGQRAAHAIADQLVGLPVAVMNLHLFEKGDLAQFCKLYQDDTYSEFHARVPKPKVVSQTEVLQAQAVQALADSSKQLTLAVRADSETRKQLDINALAAAVRANLDRVELQTGKATITPAKSIVQRNREKLALARANPQRVLGLRTGFPSLDHHTRGLLDGTVNVIYGAASMGKSTLAVAVAAALLDQGAGMVVPTESQPGRWVNKLAAQVTRIPLDKIESGELDAQQLAKVDHAYTRIESRINLDFLEGSRPTPNQIRSAVLDLKLKWLIIDSGSNLNVPGADDIYTRTTGVSNFVQDLALSTGLVVVMTWQVNRATNQRGAGNKMPNLSDAQGGEVIGQDADRVFGLYNHQYYVDQGTEDPDDRYPEGTSLVKVLKDRHYGARGKTVTLNYVNDAALYELERRPEILNVHLNGAMAGAK